MRSGNQRPAAMPGPCSGIAAQTRGATAMRGTTARGLVLLAVLAGFPPPRVLAADAPQLRRLLQEARLVAAGNVGAITTHDNGRLAVGTVHVTKMIKGTR